MKMTVAGILLHKLHPRQLVVLKDLDVMQAQMGETLLDRSSN